jgi:hypothetical protein
MVGQHFCQRYLRQVHPARVSWQLQAQNGFGIGRKFSGFVHAAKVKIEIKEWELTFKRVLKHFENKKITHYK